MNDYTSSPENDNLPTQDLTESLPALPQYRVSGKFYKPVERNEPRTILVYYDRRYAAPDNNAFSILVTCDALSVYQTAKHRISRGEGIPLDCVSIERVELVKAAQDE